MFEISRIECILIKDLFVSMFTILLILFKCKSYREIYLSKNNEKESTKYKHVWIC